VRARSARVGDIGLRVVYFELLNALYLEGGELPVDPAKLADNLLLPEKEIARVLPILSKSLGAITIRNGKLSQPRVTKELTRCRSLSEKRRASARSRWDANAEQTDANGERTQSRALHGAKATAKAKAQAKATAQAVEETFNYWKEHTGHSRAMLTDARRKKLASRLSEEGGHIAGLKLAVDGAIADPWYAGKNEDGRRYWGFDNIFRSRERIEKLQDSAKRFGKPAPKKPQAKLPPHDNDAAALLEEVKTRLDKVPAHSKRTWIDPCSGWAFENDGTVLIVACPSAQHAEWLRGYFKEPLKAALHATRPGMLVRAVVREVTP
jgi:hypothetical protein